MHLNNLTLHNLTLNIIILFKDFSKLLICGGYPFTVTCEVINLASSASTCQNLTNFPARVFQAIGGLGFKENPLICGGVQNGVFSNKCYSLGNNEWVSSASMYSVRTSAAAAQLQDGKLLVTGGFDGSYSLKSAEMLAEEGWESNIPSLPVTIYGHCMVTVNSTTVMAIGGGQNGHYYRKTFSFTFGQEHWTEGPELKNKRVGHSCGKIRRNKESQEMSIIVAGGSGGSYLSSVEILDEDSNDWQTGPELPFGIYYSQMVEDQNGGVVVIGGRSLSSGNLDTLYQLPHGGQDAVWTKMEQKMNTGRYAHTAFLVPDNIVDCS
jgi:N-acetylneuraminic acid mutarotase